MVGIRKKHRLLLQIIAIVLPLFAVMTAVVIWAVYCVLMTSRWL